MPFDEITPFYCGIFQTLDPKIAEYFDIRIILPMTVFLWEKTQGSKYIRENSPRGVECPLFDFFRGQMVRFPQESETQQLISRSKMIIFLDAVFYGIPQTLYTKSYPVI